MTCFCEPLVLVMFCNWVLLKSDSERHLGYNCAGWGRHNYRRPGKKGIRAAEPNSRKPPGSGQDTTTSGEAQNQEGQNMTLSKSSERLGTDTQTTKKHANANGTDAPAHPDSITPKRNGKQEDQEISNADMAIENTETTQTQM